MRIGLRAHGLSAGLSVRVLASAFTAVPMAACVANSAIAMTPAVLQTAMDEYVPVVLVRDVPLMERSLLLDEGQRAILSALAADLAAGTPGRESSINFLESLRAILTDEQIALIPDALREIRRDRMQTAASIAGESIDVGMVAQRHLRGIAVEGADQLISQYWRELDVLLAARESATPLTNANADREQGRRTPRDRSVEARGSATGSREVLQTRVFIRELNDRAIAELTTAMPEALARDFELNALAEAYPNAYVPSGTLEQLKAIAAEHPSPALTSLRDEAARRLDGLRRRAVDAIRKRDAAPLSGGEAQVAADKVIATCEKEYADFESWLLEAITAAESPEQLAKTSAGRALLERAKVSELATGHNWDDQQATVSRFDTDGDGQLNGDESSQILDAYVRSMGKRSRWRL